MADESPLPDWFPRPQTWPQWMPNALWNGGLVPPVPPEIPARIAFDWEEGPTGGLIGRPNPLWSRSNARWWESIQEYEGHARGGGGGTIIKSVLEGMSWEDAIKNYRRLAGEAEAHNAEKRLRWSDDRRRAELFPETEDPPRDQQIIRYFD